MIKVRHLTSCMAISALAAMTACSSLGMGGSSQQAAVSAPPPAPAAAPAQPQNVELSPALIKRVQTVLKQDHMYRGRVDGVWGPMTQRGVTQFQQKNNLQATGTIDGPTLDAMNLGGNGSMSGSNMSGGNNMDSGAMGSSGNMGTNDNMSGGGSMNNGSGAGMSGGTGTGAGMSGGTGGTPGHS